MCDSFIEPDVSMFDSPQRSEAAHVDRTHTRHHLRHILVWRVQRALWQHVYGYGHRGVGVIGIILIVLVILALTGRP
jgi:hypothetical protein